MRIIECKDYEEMSRRGAQIFAGQVAVKPDSVLGLATGSTPIGLYNELAAMNLDFSEIKTFNLDEYYPIQRSNDQSYYYFMNEHLYSKVNLRPENIHIPNGEAPDADAECAGYEKQIEAAGGIDIQLLGIGQNGHIAFNEPDKELFAYTHKTGLTENTIEANSRFFASKDEVPRLALTMGIATIMKARKIVLLANGKNKADAVRMILSGKITPECPATILAAHNDVTILADGEALGK